MNIWLGNQSVQLSDTCCPVRGIGNWSTLSHPPSLSLTRPKRAVASTTNQGFSVFLTVYGIVKRIIFQYEVTRYTNYFLSCSVDDWIGYRLFLVCSCSASMIDTCDFEEVKIIFFLFQSSRNDRIMSPYLSALITSAPFILWELVGHQYKEIVLQKIMMAYRSRTEKKSKNNDS